MVPNKIEHSIPAIYLITNTVNGKIYVGSAVDFYNRYMVYKSTFHKENRYIARAMRKYGFEAFEFSILEKVLNKKLLQEREQFYMDFYRVCDLSIGYNIAPIAQSNVGVKHTEEARHNMSIAQTGRTQSELTINRRVKAMREGGGYKRIAEVKSKPVVQIDVNTLQVICEFSSCVAAARAFGREDCHTVVSGVCRKKKNMRTAFGYFWSFKSEYDFTTYNPTPKVNKMSPHFYEGSRPIWQCDMNNEKLAIWESSSDAAHFLRGKRGAHSAISNACSGRVKTAYGYKWQHVDDADIISIIKAKRKREYDQKKNIRDIAYAATVR